MIIMDGFGERLHLKVDAKCETFNIMYSKWRRWLRVDLQVAQMQQR